MTMNETIKFHFKVLQNFLKKIAKPNHKPIKTTKIPTGARAVSAILKNMIDPPNCLKSYFYTKQSNEINMKELPYTQDTGLNIETMYFGYDKFIESVELTT